ncbi:MAG: diacylglycerol kinase family protein [Thermodesulfobacteriota bacterium]
MRILVIGSPIAGTGQAERRVDGFVRALKRKGHDVEAFLTTAPGQARQKARDLTDGIDRLVVAGGDGTINEVLNGLPDPSKVPLLHLPAGTANQLARTLGLPSDPSKLVRILESGPIRRIDMGLAGEHRFLLVAGAGFDAWVTEEIKRHRQGSLGYSGYVSPILKTITAYRPTKMDVVLDGHERIPACNVVVLKVRRYGGLLVFADDARLDSGFFHVCIFPEGSIGWLCLYAVGGLVGKAGKIPGIIRKTAQRVQIQSDKPVPVEIDGDYFGMTPVDLHIRPSVVPVVTPG